MSHDSRVGHPQCLCVCQFATEIAQIGIVYNWIRVGMPGYAVDLTSIPTPLPGVGDIKTKAQVLLLFLGNYGTNVQPPQLR